MKKLIVEIEDGTKTGLMERVEVKHFCDLGNEVKCAIEHFVRANEGALIPPISIHVAEKETSGATEVPAGGCG